MRIQSVSIKNFKVFGDFAVDGLRPVTLVGGDNNCGKSTLLEALVTCLNRRHWAVGHRAVNASWAGVMPVFYPLRTASIVDENALTRLVHGGGEFDAPVVVSCRVDGVWRTVTVSPYSDNQIGDAAVSFADMKNSDSGVFVPRPPQQTLVEYSEGKGAKNKKITGGVVVTVDQNGVRHRTLDENARVKKKQQEFKILAVMDGDLTAEVWSSVPDLLTDLDRKGDKQLILDALRIIAPKATDVSVGTIRGAPLALVQMDGMKSKIPADLLGMGARKFLLFVLAMHSNENMLCLLDEVTVGWHHSRLVELWRMIIRACKERNHQVIATTHSYESIAAFAEAAKIEKAEDDACYVRLPDPAKRRNGIRPKPYEHDLIEGAMRSRLEIR